MSLVTRCVGVVAALTVAVAVPVSSAPRGQEPPPSTAGLAVELLGSTPWVDVDGTLTIDVQVGDAVDDLNVHLHGLLESSDELAASMTAAEGPVIFTGTFPVEEATTLDNGATRLSFDVSATVNEGTTMRMAYAGVYPLVVTPLDDDGNAGSPIRTPVIRRSGAGTTLTAPDLAVVVDVSARPTMTVDGRRPFTPTELERFSRLGRFIDSAGGRPITVLANTDTLAALAETEAAGARNLHASLTAPGVVVVPQPVVPLDWPVMSVADLDHLIPGMIAAGRGAVAATGATMDDGVWDARGGVDPDALDAIADAGFDRVLITPSDPDADRITERDRTVTDGPDDLDVFAVDEATTRSLLAPVASPDAIDAGAVAAADLILRSSHADATSMIVVDDVPDDAALYPAVAASDDAGPISLVTLQSADDEDASTVTATEPDVVDMAEMTELANAISDAVASIDLYESVTGTDDAAAVTAAARAMVAGSVQRGIDRADRTLLIAGASQLTSWVADSVTFVGPIDLNLTSRTGTLPIGVVNHGTTTVTLLLAVRSDRLRFPDGSQITVEIAPGEARLDLPVEALASGSVPLYVELHSPDGSLTVASRQFNVRSTAVSGVGMALSIGAIVVLLVWWIRTWRKGRAARV